MHDISMLLKQKEQELARLQKEVDALRLVAIMFERSKSAEASATENARVSNPLPVKPPSLPPLEVPTAAISNNPATSAVSESFGNGAAKRFP
jgi:hypothetical protein